ncbi:GNAT family N-acetyltransferase [candidate division WS5 bacterium]|uniref:GNAT family N-acetyltransferase n=1 Tax=candidate division WS5 bacterium TaxID=2093353 RepID=A0A419DET9_9BACT|nr:MAG: GNAT family N-acetyltransferase [candidate division WS5 bacterium]
MKIRKASIKDIETIQSLEYELYQETKEIHDPTFNPDWAKSEETAEKYRTWMEEGVYIAFICEEDKEPIGILVGGIKEAKHRVNITWGKIDHLFVKKEFRNKGIGTQLLKNFEKWAKQNGANREIVYTHTVNHSARKLYQREGFEESEIIFEKKL